MPEDNKHLGGDKIPAGPHLKYHNVYGYLMVKDITCIIFLYITYNQIVIIATSYRKHL